MPTVNGILETALYVDDVERSTQFYQTLFGFDRRHEMVPGLRRNPYVQSQDTAPKKWRWVRYRVVL